MKRFIVVPEFEPFFFYGGKIGVSHNIGYASLKGIICAVNRDQEDCVRDDTMPGIFEK